MEEQPANSTGSNTSGKNFLMFNILPGSVA
jgi:hypothetical protein